MLQYKTFYLFSLHKSNHILKNNKNSKNAIKNRWANKNVSSFYCFHILYLRFLMKRHKTFNIIFGFKSFFLDCLYFVFGFGFCYNLLYARHPLILYIGLPLFIWPLFIYCLTDNIYLFLLVIHSLSSLFYCTSSSLVVVDCSYLQKNVL